MTQLQIPKGYRKGQFIYDFLEWLKREKEEGDYEELFYMNDEEFDEFWEELIKLLKVEKK